MKPLPPALEIETFSKSLTEVNRSRTDSETEGFVKIHVKKKHGSDCGRHDCGDPGR